jgi:hypothetical protein
LKKKQKENIDQEREEGRRTRARQKRFEQGVWILNVHRGRFYT